MWLFDYFRRKAEERKKKRKDEILAELEPEFSKAIKDAAAGLEARMKELRAELEGVKSKSEEVSEEVDAVKRVSEIVQACAEEAKKDAGNAADSARQMGAAASRANELCDSIDAKLKDIADSSVRQCSEAVHSEMQDAVQAAREEYKTNLEDSTSLLEEKNMKRMSALSAELKAMAAKEIEAFKKEHQKINASYQEIESSCRELGKRIDNAAGKFKSIEEQINRLEDIMQGRPQYMVSAILLSSTQRQQLRELHSSQYKGDVVRYRKYLEDRRENQLKGKGNSLTPAELEIDYAPRAFDNMLAALKQYRREEMPALLEVVEFVDGIKKKGYSGSPQPGKRQGRRVR